MNHLVFDSAALAAAVDTRRRALGRTWSQVTAETHVSTSTIKRGGDMEVDGVVWLLQWLGVPFETFQREPSTPGAELAATHLAPDDGLPPGAPRWPGYRRFDTSALYAALDQRRDLGLSWEQVAAAIAAPGVTSATLRAFQKGGRTTTSRLVPVLAWLGEPATHFTTLPATARSRASTNPQSTIDNHEAKS